ncbi:hypothetical protein THAOC_14507, partial [Thalassiosira oceanica]
MCCKHAWRARVFAFSIASRRRRGTNPRPRPQRDGDTGGDEPPHPPNLNGPRDPGVAPESPNKKPPNGSGDSTTRLSSVSLNLCLDQASLAELEAVAGAEAVDGLSVPNEKTGLPEATPPILGAVPHRGSVSDGNGVHGGFLWCVEEETEQPATPAATALSTVISRVISPGVDNEKMAEDTTEAASGTSGQPVAKKAKTEAEGRARAGGLNAKLAAETKANPPAPVEVRRLDYRALQYAVTKVSMDFKLHSGHTEVDTTMTVEKKCDGDLILDGEEATVILISLALDGVETLEEGVDYVFEPGKLIIRGVALERAASSNNGNMIVKTSVCICPESNTQLSGLYKSGPMFCSQCEAEGFRRITYYPDRPDNMAIFTVRVEADASYQVLLSNGNLVEEGECGEGETKRKFAVWSDPFPKPS